MAIVIGGMCVRNRGKGEEGKTEGKTEGRGKGQETEKRRSGNER